MKRLLLSLAAALVVALAAVAAPGSRFDNEDLNYNISYKWGLVQKNAGTCRISLRVNGDRASATLTGRTDPWADKIYKVRDTLRANFSLSTLKPSRYERIAHENDYYAHDIVDYTHSGNNVTAATTVIRRSDKKPLRRENYRLSASGEAVDMLSVLYYIRLMDFANMVRGQSKQLTIFSGKKKENLSIRYINREDIKIDGRTYSAYRVAFTFTSDGKKKSSESISAWISTDARRIPLKIEGSLKIGKVRCIYSPR